MKKDAVLTASDQFTCVSAYDEKQKEKRKAIESRPLFDATSSATASSLLSPNPSSTISSSTSSSDRSQKNFTLEKIRQISESERRKQRSVAFASTLAAGSGRNRKRTRSSRDLGIVIKKARTESTEGKPSKIGTISAGSREVLNCEHSGVDRGLQKSLPTETLRVAEPESLCPETRTPPSRTIETECASQPNGKLLLAENSLANLSETRIKARVSHSETIGKSTELGEQTKSGESENEAESGTDIVTSSKNRSTKENGKPKLSLCGYDDSSESDSSSND